MNDTSPEVNPAPGNTQCEYPVAICGQLRWLQRRVFYQFLQTGCPTIDLQANLDISDNQADLQQRLAVPIPELCAMPPILRGSVKHAQPNVKHNRKPS
ncbi:MAG: hypothetical protein B7X37_06905 [Halothiobacillus sp. 14-55-98]|jgi:hypothetical protein|nr:MAG: hypothetical protein B7X37_06905 [Halothiobacillus sp. 14-55-98]